MQRCASAVVGVFAAVVITGCESAGIATPVDSPVTIERSELVLTVRNVSGQALNNITIGIKPTGVRPEYQMTLPRLANGEDTDIPFTEFRGIDRDSLELQNVGVRLVHITATDINGTEYDVELPWE
jgi:hypothetical protein